MPAWVGQPNPTGDVPQPKQPCVVKPPDRRG